MREWLLGLLFIGPATLITLIFGLYPVVYGFFVSVQAMGAVAYILAFAVAWICVWAGYRVWRSAYKAMHEGKGDFRLYLLPAAIAAPATLAVFALIFLGAADLLLFPLAALVVAFALFVLIGLRTPGTPLVSYTLRAWGLLLLTLSAVLLVLFAFQQMQDNTASTFSLVQPLFDDAGIYLPTLGGSFQTVGILAAALTAAVGLFWLRRVAAIQSRVLLNVLVTLGMIAACLAVIASLGFLLARADQLRVAAMSLDQVDQDKLNAALSTLNNGTTISQLVNDLLTWPAVFAVLLGTALIGGAYLIWQTAVHRASTLGLFALICLAIALAIGGWLLIGELPNAVASGDPTFYNSLLRTATYSMVAVPAEIGLGLGLAYLLFYEVSVGRGLFRLIYFIPYIAPTVATAAVFSVIFSLDSNSPANQFMRLFGLPAQQWLRKPTGVFEVIAQIIGGSQTQLPSFLVGPSLPLVTVIIYSVWVFSGYNAVIFMAGLGAVPRELYEAAQVDGAGRWMSFRKITLPLLSPTTFFLTMLAIIGTFQALTHIYVMRQLDSRGAMDVATVKIYDAIRYGLLPYASSMAFILFGLILILTLVQSRITRDQVFYG